MGKNNGKYNHDDQLELLQEAPDIAGLGIVKLSLKDGEIRAEVQGATNVNDVGKLPRSAWAMGLARWLVELCEGENLSEFEGIHAMVLVAAAEEELRKRRGKDVPVFDNSESAGLTESESGTS